MSHHFRAKCVVMVLSGDLDSGNRSWFILVTYRFQRSPPPGMSRSFPSQNCGDTCDLSSLAHLWNCLEELDIDQCGSITGSFMDLAGFTKLKKISLRETTIAVDVRQIAPEHFPALESLDIREIQRPMDDNADVYGDRLRSSNDVPAFMSAWHRLTKHRPLSLERSIGTNFLRLRTEAQYSCVGVYRRLGELSPFLVRFVSAGGRSGYQWTNGYDEGCCDINWLDPEPLPSEEGYERYVADRDTLEKGHRLFTGYLRPPSTREEYERIIMM